MVTMEEKTEIILKEKRLRFEAHIKSWDGTEMWYQEGALHFPGIVKIKTDDWGVKLTLDSKHFDELISLSGRWDILSVGESGMTAMYCGWTIDKEMIFPELGINLSISWHRTLLD